jgi:hypothetical protein
MAKVSDFDKKTSLGFTETPEIKAIMELLYEKSDYFKPGDNYRPWEGMTVEQAEKLLTLLPGFQKKDKQNDAPTFEEFVELGKKFPGMWFHGYHITSAREDERITIEGFYMPWDLLDKEGVAALAGLRADEFTTTWKFKGRRVVRAWWD